MLTLSAQACYAMQGHVQAYCLCGRMNLLLGSLGNMRVSISPYRLLQASTPYLAYSLRALE